MSASGNRRDRFRSQALPARLASGLVLAVISIVASWAGGWYFSFFLFVILMTALWEFLRMGSRAYPVLVIPGLLAGASVLILAFTHNAANVGIVLIAVSIWMMGASLRSPIKNRVVGLAVTVMGVLYVTGLGLHVLWLREMDKGLELLILVLLGTWAAPDAMCCAYPMVVSPDGTLWARIRVRVADRGRRTTAYALQAHGPEGPVGPVRWPTERDYEPVQIEVTTPTGHTVSVGVPFGPRTMWATASSGAIVAGASDRYRFEIQSDVGSIVVAERYWNPIPIGLAEAEWHRRMFVAGVRLEMVPQEWTWDGAEMPSTKPAFSGLVPAASGEIWVVRDGEGEHLPDCVDDPIEVGWLEAQDAPCWRDATILDVFDNEGRYLGEVESPRNIRPFPPTCSSATSWSLASSRTKLARSW